MRSIVTVTLNPAIDRTAWIERLEPGATHRTATSRASIGGKGINVARTAARLGAPVIALGVAGEDQAARIEQHLASAGIRARFLAVEGETRTNLKLIERADGRMTEINGTGPEVNADVLERLTDELFGTVAREHPAAVVLAGSLPAGVPADVYARWTHGLHRSQGDGRGPEVIVDASDEPLVLALDAHPFLVKPNRVEAGTILGRTIDGDEDACRAARELVARGPRAVLLSLGAGGAVAAMGDTAEWIPAADLATSEGRLVTTVGAGDAMVARIAVEVARRDPATAMTPSAFIAACRLAVEQAAAHISTGA